MTLTKMFQCKKSILLCSLLAMCVTAEVNKDLKVTNLIHANAIPDENKWPRNAETLMVMVPFVINSTVYSDAELETLKQGMADIEAKTCVRFVDRNAEKDYIYIYDGGEGKCNGAYGRTGNRQNLQLTPRCMNIRKKCVHELLHGLGFHHMQQRFDRSKYVTINWASIDPKDRKWFHRFDNQWEAYNTTYDLFSCMHYARKAFSNNGNDTIIPKDPAYLNVIGKQLTLSEGDATRINRMYDCQHQ